MITSSDQTYNDIGHIDHYTGNDRSDIISTGIAFARAGMHKLDITQELKDPHFDGGSQWYEREALGDQSWRDYDPIFSGPEKTHGVILVTSKGRLVLTIILASILLTGLLRNRTGHMRRKDG